MVEREMPVPIRKIVAVRPSRPKVKTDLLKVMKVGTYVFMMAAKQKNNTNQGNGTRVLLLFSAAVTSARGTIQSARASFTVVPITSACAPYLAVAPTTELVS